jgi:hypothetical protein
LTTRRLDNAARYPQLHKPTATTKRFISDRNERKEPSGLQGRRQNPLYPDWGKVGNASLL